MPWEFSWLLVLAEAFEAECKGLLHFLSQKWFFTLSRCQWHIWSYGRWWSFWAHLLFRMEGEERWEHFTVISEVEGNRHCWKRNKVSLSWEHCCELVYMPCVSLRLRSGHRRKWSWDLVLYDINCPTIPHTIWRRNSQEVQRQCQEQYHTFFEYISACSCRDRKILCPCVL